MSLKIRITLLIMCCAVLTTSLFTGGTMAWFSNSIAKEIVFESGSIKYTISGELINDGNTDGYTIVVPGQLLTDNDGNVILTNKSNIDTQLRMQILYSYVETLPDGTEIPHNDVPYSPEAGGLTEFMDITLHPKWSYIEENVSDEPGAGVIKCFEFEYSQGNFSLPKAADPSVGEDIPLLQSISFSGTNITPEFSGTTFALKLFFQVKQKNIATWQDLGTLDFYVSS